MAGEHMSVLREKRGDKEVGGNKGKRLRKTKTMDGTKKDSFHRAQTKPCSERGGPKTKKEQAKSRKTKEKRFQPPNFCRRTLIQIH